MTNGADANRQRAVTIASTAIEMGLHHVVLSPGARNTPIVLALHDMQEQGWPIQLHSILDERAAGFYALGIARRTDKPVLLCCTSGSAGTHYYPAIVEAAQGEVPLLVITADRPEELQNRGAPQTMPQQNLYGPHVRFFCDLGAPEPGMDEESTKALVFQAMEATLGTSPGPVHINAPFRKPLWQAGGFTPTPAESRPMQRTPGPPTAEQIERFVQQKAQKKGVIVVGPDPSARVPDDAVRSLAKLLGWPILADPVSQLRYGRQGPIVHNHDVLLRSARFREQCMPELAITLGGTTSSKPLAQLLGNIPCIHISGGSLAHDPWQSVIWTMHADLGPMIAAIGDTSSDAAPSPWQDAWQTADKLAADAIQTACSEILWEGSIAHNVVKSMPDDSLLRLASSMPIRDADSFSPRSTAKLTVSSNRGVNGIDGLIATSLGEALVHQGPAAVLSGDLSFLHDIGSLACIPRPTQPVVFVVVDNNGGGIFGFLPMAEHDTGFEPRFVTPHHQDIPTICAGFGVPVCPVNDLTDLPTQLEEKMMQPGLHVLYISVDRHASTQLHFDAFRAIAHHLDNAL